MVEPKFKNFILLIAVVIVANILVWSRGFLGVSFSSESPLVVAFGAAFLAGSFIALIYGSYTYLFKPKPVVKTKKEVVTHEDYVDAMKSYGSIQVLRNDVDLALNQLERMKNRKMKLLEVLEQRFDASELSYKKFYSVVHAVEDLFYKNIKSILNKLGVFSVSDFAAIADLKKNKKLSAKIIEEKMQVYNEYLQFVNDSLNTNEEILLKLDKLLLEIARLGSLDMESIENMSCMKEIDALIKQTKLYKD
ncbi:hypothetical protein GNP94_12490 [Paenibacillus campinasensis]|uniref:5-bromo-4-chloroindolyl phosphate hydrolysis protein n=1 Tax=Paenibacillus campinasensis TaxID=66347 RepID=A0ABW9T283_9BACL|nr:hypothetical protein [Paenibacillus campinasensis]MUG66822.1 hypothetical protein [Paenibacillus campinasensis]